MRRTLVTKIGLCATMALSVAAGGCIVYSGDHYEAKATRTDQLSAPVGNATALRVTTDVGAIKLEAGETAEVRISADITVKAETDEEAQRLLDSYHVTVEPSGDTLVVKAEKPSSFGRNQLCVDLTITAPPGLKLDCATDVGDIRTDGFTNRVEARSDVGSITCTGLRSSATLHSNVGNIKFAYASDAPGALDATAATNVGDIEFEGPQQVSAKVAAATNVGSIHSDRPLTVRGQLSQSINASLGDGQGHVSLGTNVGSIRIR
jgi:hypothetical protein